MGKGLKTGSAGNVWTVFPNSIMPRVQDSILLAGNKCQVAELLLQDPDILLAGLED